MYQITPNWTWTLNTYALPIYFPLRPKFGSVLLYDQPFSRYKDAKSEMSEIYPKYTKWPRTDFGMLRAKSISYKLSNHPRGPNVGPFCCKTSLFPRYKVAENRKSWKCTEWPQTELEYLTVKKLLYTWNTYPWGPNFGPFHSTTIDFQDTRLPKIGNAPNDPKLKFNT